MLLSTCLIARNEEANLPRAIKSVAGLADEIIVADTGSTDRTCQIASELGARVVCFPWCDDFAAARNYAIEQARGEWILWLDADEELLPESIPELRASLSRRDALAFLVLRQDLVAADRPDLYTHMWQLRLFRRHPALRFVGRCHPHFEDAIQQVCRSENLQVFTSSITLRHYGYVTEMRESKLRRAAHLLELELKERPAQLYYLIEYGRTLLKLGDARGREVLNEAAGQLGPCLRDPEAPVPIVASLLEYLLSLPDSELPAGQRRADVLAAAQRWFPRAAPLIWLQAQDHFAGGRFAEAEQLLRTLVRMGREHSYDPHVSFDPTLVGERAALNLGVCLVRQAKLAEAEQCFRTLQTSRDFGPEARQNLAIVHGLLNEHRHKLPQRSRRPKRRQ